MKAFIRVLSRIVLCLILIVVVTEAVLRLTQSYKLQRWEEVKCQADTVLGYRYQANAHGIVSDAAYIHTYSINSHGFAGHEFTTKKAKGVYRIAVTGASDETGLYMDGSRSAADLLDELLSKNGYNAEVINLAVDGHGKSIRNVEFIRKECIDYEPDLILYKDLDFPLKDFMQYRMTYRDVLIKYTDTAVLPAAKAYVDSELAHKDLRLYIYDYCYIYRYLAKTYLEHYQKDAFWERAGRPLFGSPNRIECYARHLIFWPGYRYEPKTYSDEESFRILRDLSAELARKNIKFIVFDTYVIEDKPMVIRNFAENRINYLPLEVPRKPEYSFGGLDGHTSQEGQKAIAYALYNLLRDSIGRHITPE